MQHELITVYYDGKCGMCAKEIRYYKKIAPNNIFDWQDITVSTQSLKQSGVSLTEGLKYLHVKNTEGKLLIGVDAFICIWQQLPYWRYLAYLVKLPMIKQIATVIYKAFAHWRFKKITYCNLN